MAIESDYFDQNKGSTLRKYKHIHEELMTKVEMKEKANSDNAKAQQIENFLKQIKMLDREPNNKVDEEFIAQAREIVDSTLSILNKARRSGGNNNSRLTAANLLRRSHKVKHLSASDDIFEDEFAALIAAVQNKFAISDVNINLNTNGTLTGHETGNINMAQTIAKETLDLTVEETKKELTQRLTVNGKSLYKDIREAKAIKTDVMAPVVAISADIHPLFQQFLSAIQGRSFSLKNYNSIAADKKSKKTGKTYNSLQLGQTGYYKSAIATLNSLGYSDKYAKRVFYGSIEIMKKSSESASDNEVLLHLYHLRFAYELTGNGIYDSDGTPISDVDFLIYNDPGSDNIFVRSTAQMILDTLNNSMTGSTGSKITIAKSYFDK